MDSKLRVVTTRHSPFYSPVICLVAGGFLEREGIAATLGGLDPGDSAYTALRDGRADVMQSAVSANWGLIEKGLASLPVHFAQINRRDGFFLSARHEDPVFDWAKLEGKTLLADHGAQPLAMLKYAVQCQGVDCSRVKVVDAGTPTAILVAFRAGEGDYVHLQGPGPQELAAEGKGHVVAMVGEAMPATAFSSLSARRDFPEDDAFEAFIRAFARAKEWTRQSAPEDVAETIAPYFPGVPRQALATCVSCYQHLGTWDGGIGIPPELYEQTLNVFESGGRISCRHPYETVCLNVEPQK